MAEERNQMDFMERSRNHPPPTNDRKSPGDAAMNPELRSRLLADPAHVLREHGIEISDGVEARVIENTAEHPSGEMDPCNLG